MQYAHHPHFVEGVNRFVDIDQPRHFVDNGKMWAEIKTWGEAIDALGGNTKVAQRFKDVTPGAVYNWRTRGIPAKAWLVLAPLLKRKGQFSPKLFDMLEPADGGRDGG